MLGYLLAAGAFAVLCHYRISWTTWPLMIISLLVFLNNLLPIVRAFRRPEFIWIVSTSNGIHCLLLIIFLWRVTKRIDPVPGVQWVFPLGIGIDAFVIAVSMGLTLLLPLLVAGELVSRSARISATQATNLVLSALTFAAQLCVAIATISVLWHLRRKSAAGASAFAEMPGTDPA